MLVTEHNNNFTSAAEDFYFPICFCRYICSCSSFVLINDTSIAAYKQKCVYVLAFREEEN